MRVINVWGVNNTKDKGWAAADECSICVYMTSSSTTRHLQPTPVVWVGVNKFWFITRFSIPSQKLSCRTRSLHNKGWRALTWNQEQDLVSCEVTATAPLIDLHLSDQHRSEGLMFNCQPLAAAYNEKIFKSWQRVDSLEMLREIWCLFWRGQMGGTVGFKKESNWMTSGPLHSSYTQTLSDKKKQLYKRKKKKDQGTEGIETAMPRRNNPTE